MTEQEIFHAIAGAGAGGGLTFTLGWAIVQKLLKNLEENTRRIQEMSLKLSEINIKLGLLDAHNHAIDKLKDTIHLHDKLIGIIHSQTGQKKSNDTRSD